MSAVTDTGPHAECCNTIELQKIAKFLKSPGGARPDPDDDWAEDELFGDEEPEVRGGGQDLRHSI